VTQPDARRHLGTLEMETQTPAGRPGSVGTRTASDVNRAAADSTSQNVGVADNPGDLPKLRIIGVDASHDTLRRIVGARPPARILDVPAGEGIFCAFLKDRGWDVHAADIDPGNFKLRDIPFTRVNLNQALPFDSSAFDAVSCINGLHRLLFPEVAIREFARILRPGGRLYINVNNYSSIWKRLRFLVTGSIDQAIENQECIQTIDDPEAHVRLPLMYPRLHAMLARAGFTVADVQPAAVTSRDRLLAPLAMVVSVAGRLVPAGRREAMDMAEGNHRAVLCGGAYLFVEAVKASAAGSDSR
jgi:SAM-dependent methyltransferase